jgi:hypothetical protein
MKEIISRFNEFPKLKITKAGIVIAFISLFLVIIFFVAARISLSMVFSNLRFLYTSNENVLSDNFSVLVTTIYIIIAVICVMPLTSLTSAVLSVVALVKKERSWTAFTGLILGVLILAFSVFLLYCACMIATMSFSD